MKGSFEPPKFLKSKPHVTPPLCNSIKCGPWGLACGPLWTCMNNMVFNHIRWFIGVRKKLTIQYKCSLCKDFHDYNYGKHLREGPLMCLIPNNNGLFVIELTLVFGNATHSCQFDSMHVSTQKAVSSQTYQRCYDKWGKHKVIYHGVNWHGCVSFIRQIILSILHEGGTQGGVLSPLSMQWLFRHWLQKNKNNSKQ